jgi:hypothetical protein
MANNIKPEISLGVKGPQAMTLGELVGTATKAMEFSKLSELYPELISKARAESQATQFGLAEKQMSAITSGMTALINNPLVVRAEEAPDQVDQQKLLSYVKEHGYNQAKMLGIPQEKADALIAPYLKMAAENPRGLRPYAKERLLAGLDTASRASAFGGAQAVGALTQLPRELTDKPVGVTPEAMTAPMGAAVSQVPPSQMQATPIAPMAQAPMGQAPTQAPMAQAPQGGAGFALPYPIPIRGVQQATTPSEATDLATGQKYRGDLIATQTTVNKSARNVDAVLSGIKDLEKDRRFTTGPLASREQYIKEFFGDERFKQLSKDIANVELAVLQASGQSMSTDAGKSLVAKANGDETYPPSVLLSVANRLAGDLTRIDMEARGAQKFAQQFGDSNLPAYRQAWAANADQKIFEAMYITKNERDIKRRNEALDKLLPKNKSELNEFLNKYENIEKLTQTGRLQ